MRGALHSFKSVQRTALSDSARVWGTGVPDYFEEMNKEGYLTPGRPCLVL